MNSRLSRLLAATGAILVLAGVARMLRPRSVKLLLNASSHYGPTVLLCLLLMGLVAGLITYYEYHGFGPQEGIVRRGPKNNTVAITFDDGPSPTYTPLILDVLRDKDVKATFFCTGVHVEKYVDVARRIVAEGHDIGNHTYSHRDLLPATRTIAESQVRRAEEAILKATGVETSLFRPPRGLYSEMVRRIVVDEFGLKMILWSVSALDWRRLTPRKIVRRIARHIHPGGIILFHDSGALVRREGGARRSTVEALPLVIDYLRDAGYEILPVSQLILGAEGEKLEPDRVLERA